MTAEIDVTTSAFHCEGCCATIDRLLSGPRGVQAVEVSEESQVVHQWDCDAIGVGHGSKNRSWA